MNKMKNKIAVALLMIGGYAGINAQEVQSNQSLFDEFLDHNGNEFRAATGKPGEDYWQNETDYKIEATLDHQA